MSEPTLYDSYTAFKNWSVPGEVTRPEDFEGLLREAGSPPGPLDLLDYGFGEGAFLDWARSAGHRVVGVEILPEMIASATARGHRAILAERLAADLGETRLDAIVLMDVMEHLDRAAFHALMALARKALKPGGMIVARFPNGASPVFGRFHYSDLTHERPLTALSVAQLAAPEGMKVVRAFNPRPVPPGLVKGLKRRVAYATRDLIEIVLGFVYFGYRFPMDPNVAITLMRAEDAPSAARDGEPSLPAGR